MSGEAGPGFAEWVEARQHRLLRTAFLLTGDLHLAEDLLQDALIKVALNWKRVRGEPEAYTRTILYRDSVSWWRKHRRERATDTVPDQVVDDGADASAQRIMFARALATLAPRQRAVLVLRYFEDLTEAAAAEVLGVSVGTVKSQTHDALRRLRATAPELGELLGQERS